MPTPSKSTAGKGVHFSKDFLAPYGKAFKDNSFTERNVLKQLTPTNCEFLKRPRVAFSEMADTILSNFEVVQEKLDNVRKGLPKMLKRIKSIEGSLKTLSSYHENDETPHAAVNTVVRFLHRESSFTDAFLQEALEFSSSLYLSMIWLLVGRSQVRNPKYLVDNAEGDIYPATAKDPTMESLVEDLKSLVMDVHSPTKQVRPRKRLIDMTDTEEEEEEQDRPKTKKRKKKKKTQQIDLSD